MVSKKDFIIGALVGFFTGLLTWRIFLFLGINFPFKVTFFLLATPLLFGGGVWMGGFLGKRFLFFNQFGKFVAVGFLGAAIDFSLLNWISYNIGVNAGLTLGWINIPGFLAAVLNNYIWNKLWVFQKKEGGLFSDFPKFFGVTLIGLAINSTAIILLTSIPNKIDGQLWLNISKVVANALAMVWNFTGYKFIAFKKHV